MNDEYEDIGYVWFSYRQENIWEGHVAISPEWQKRWVNRTSVEAIWQMVEYSGAEHLIVSHPDPHITKQLGRFGFEVTHPVCVLNIGDDNGLWRQRTHSTTPSGDGRDEEADHNRPEPRRKDG